MQYISYISPELYSFFIILFLELVLGADNIVFISFIVKNVKRPRLIALTGLSLALIIRGIMLLFLDFFVEQSNNNIIFNFSIFDLIILLGGMFLFYKSIAELINIKNISNDKVNLNNNKYKPTIYALSQIIWIDFILSFDSIVTAIAFTRNFKIIILAFAVTMIFMVTIYSVLIKFLDKYNIIRILVFIFIGFLGVKLIFESIDIKINHVYFYLIFIVFSLIYIVLLKKNYFLLNKNK